MKNLTQMNAEYCWNLIIELKKEGYNVFLKNIKSYIKNSGPLILNNGLLETMIFYAEKSNGITEKESNESNKKKAYKKLYSIINEYWQRFISENSELQDLKEALIKKYDSIEVLIITDKILKMLNILKRLVNAEIEENENDNDD